MSCIELEKLAGYWLDEIAGDEAREIEEHFLGCARCAGRLDWLAALSEGVRAVVRLGGVGLFVSGRFVEAMAKAGLRLREYDLEPDGSVNCTIGADDHAVVSRIRAPLVGIARLDVLWRVSVGDVEQPEERVTDVPFDPEAGEVLFIPAAGGLKKMPSHTFRMSLVAVDEGREQLLGHYTFMHRAS